MPRSRLTLVVALSASVLAAQSLQSQTSAEAGRASVAGPSRADPARVAGWRADVDSLVAIVRTRHWRFRGTPLPAELTERASRIRADVPTLDDDRIVVELQALLATLQDGHTLLYPFAMQRGGLSRLPITLYEFADGLAVIGADSANASLIGRRVQRIEGVPVGEIVNRLAPLLSLENTSQLRWAYPLYVTFPAFLQAAGVAAGTPDVRISLDSGAAASEVRVRPSPPPIDPGTLTLGLVPPPMASGRQGAMYLQRLADAYWFTTLHDGRTVYLQMNRVVNDQRDSLERFAARMLDTLLRPQTRALVVDLRNNSGGNAAVLPPLIRTVVAYRALKPTSPIYVLIGRQTFSAAQTLVNRLEEYVAPVLVGEETGSKPNRFGNGVSFRLPYSGVRGEISGGYNQAATSRDARTATAPQIRVGLTLRDWLAGRDPALDSISVLVR